MFVWFLVPNLGKIDLEQGSLPNIEHLKYILESDN